MQYPALIGANVESSQLPRVLSNSVLELPFGAHAHVAVASGKIAAFLAYVSYDSKNDVATYALRILNDSGSPVRARLSCILKDGSTRVASPLTFKAPPFSMRDDYVPVRLDITGRFERALVEVESDETYFSVEAPAPAFPAPKWLRWALIPLVPLVLAGATGFIAPRVAPLSAPDRVFAGTSVTIPYEASGYGSVEYSLTNRNHVQLTAGIAATPTGVLHFSIPAKIDDSPYTVRVRMRSAFSSADRVATMTAVAVAPLPRAKAIDTRPLIDELRAEPSPVRAGNTLTAWYGTHATSGDVSLVDVSGATWAQQSMSPAGKSVFAVPPAAAGKTLRVVLHAQRGRQQAQSSVETIVLASDAIAATGAGTHPEAPVAPSPPDSGGASPSMSLSSTVVAGGDNVIVRVNGMHGDVRITIADRSGATVAEGDGSQGAMSISAPVVQSVSKYFVVATFTDGVGQQSVIKTLTVTPR